MSLSRSSFYGLILAAGHGSRMRSTMPKVLHEIGQKAMIFHVIDAVRQSRLDHFGLVLGHGKDVVTKALYDYCDEGDIFEQSEQCGTAHAVLSARAILDKGHDIVLVLYGDTPMITARTLDRMVESIEHGADLAVLGFEAEDPTGYGRLVMDGEHLVEIVEEKDADPSQKSITFCNSGVMAFQGKAILPILEAIDCNNAQNEYYLTDSVKIADENGLVIRALKAEFHELRGVNQREELSQLEAVFQQKARSLAMKQGATLIDPDSVTFAHDTSLGQDVMIEPNVFFGPDVTIEDHVTVKAFSHLEKCRLEQGVTIGPFARLRPGTIVKRDAKIGNFCEVKNATIHEGAKINHLSYIGDSDIGRSANIGAGTITCNYDGFDKYKTQVGANAFIGSNSALIAPVTIGAGAYIASGSVISDDVEDDALAIARQRQSVKPQWAQKFRDKKAR